MTKMLADLVDEARHTHDMFSILGTNKRSIVCPIPGHIHHNSTPSFSIYYKDGVQWFKCHGDCPSRGFAGDVIDLVGYLQIGSYDPLDYEMRQRALKQLDNRFEISVPMPERTAKLNGSEWYDYLPPGQEVIDYAKKRGLTEETLIKFRIGQYKQFMSMPCFEEQALVGIKFRNTQPSNFRFFNLKGSRMGLFNHDAVAYSKETVFMVKGEIPCMLLDQMGYLACAPTGGEGGKWCADSWRTALVFAHVIVIGDNDKPGVNLGEARAALMGGELVFPPSCYKDIDQFILAEPENAQRMLDKWSEGGR